MSKARNLLRRHRDDKRRPRDAGKIVARNLLIRALRHADLHYVLCAPSCVVGIVVADPEDREIFGQAGRHLLRMLAGHGLELNRDYKIVHWENGTAKRSSRTWDDDVEEALTGHDRVFGFAPRAGDIPALVHLAADGIIVPDPVDRAALRGAFHAVMGRVPSDDLLAAAMGVPLHCLGAVIKPGRSPEQIMRRLERFKAAGGGEPERKPSGHQPALDDLHGLGEAAAWGRALAVDLADYRAGRITWADVDRGVLISGPPGTGKTIFARALARTCNVPIHIHSFARWQATGYLNDLLGAMRSAFDTAMQDAPCILFIDEVDAFGDRASLGGHNEMYFRKVINAFLECLDGAEGRDGVVVVGATNLPDKIDPALLRPGRLDKHVRIPLPDRSARYGILRFHLREVLSGADLTEVAERLEGASGAVIEQVVRDARRRARTARRELVLADLFAGLPPRIRLSDALHWRASVHEAGHAVVGYLLRGETGNVPVEVRVFREVMPEGDGGQTTFHRTPGFDRTKAAYLAEITTLLAGLAAEAVVLGEHAGGGGGDEASDLYRATVLAAGMEASLGLGDGLVYLASRRADELLAGIRADPVLRRRVGDTLAGCSQRAKAFVREWRSVIEATARALAERGRVNAAEIGAAIRVAAPTSSVA